LGETFPELGKQQKIIETVIQEEELGFLKTLEKGIQLFEEHVKTNKKVIDGVFAFELYDTFGFPIDLTQLLAQEQGVKVDMQSFQEQLKAQKDRSRAAGKLDTGDWVEVLKDDKEEFIGYDLLNSMVKISRYREVKQKGKSLFQLVFNLTPFYPEGGGQVGDTGYIQQGGNKVSIIDTKKENNLIVHLCKELPKELDGEFEAVVNQSKRSLTAANHTATHLLHQALRETLGSHVEQKGSLVNAEHLRFDFSHFHKMTNEELRDVEWVVNRKIRANLNLREDRNLPIAEAKERGALALFGEKYGDVVRVIQFGDSVELCGGTHVQATGEIGLFKIVSEGAVAAGVRRIEAISSEKAQAYFFHQNDVIQNLKNSLKNPKNIEQAVDALISENNQLQKEIEQFKTKAAGSIKQELLKKVKDNNGINTLIEEVSLETDSIKNIAFQLKSELSRLFLVLVSKANGKPSIT
ncbi:MAG TPA: alanine--tRNA ligase-related protein, partial [Vampirovibrionales bacterium]